MRGGPDHLTTGEIVESEMSASLGITPLILPLLTSSALLGITPLILPLLTSSAFVGPGQQGKCDAVISRKRGTISCPVAWTIALPFFFTVNKFRSKAHLIYLCYPSIFFISFLNYTVEIISSPLLVEVLIINTGVEPWWPSHRLRT